jgi:hypothetical protein
MDNNMGCGAMEPARNKEEVALLSRGTCPFTTKVFNAQAAGYSGVIVGDVEEDVDPVRMKGTGLEDRADVIMIPALMISKEDYVVLMNGRDEAQLTMSNDVDDQHPLHEERELKKMFKFSPSSAENLMQLASYMVRMGWKETGRHLLQHAATLFFKDGSRNPDVLYSIGEYFYNIEESPKDAGEFFGGCALEYVRILKTGAFSEKQSRVAYDETIKKLAEVIGIVPERQEQTDAIEALVEDEMWKDLRGVLKILGEEQKIGTAGLMTWARYIDRIGMSHACMEYLDGPWREQHQMAGDENWSSMVENAAEYVKKFQRAEKKAQKEAKEKKKAGGKTEEL